MATGQYIKTGVDLASGVVSAALTLDISKLVLTLVDLGQKVQTNTDNCKELIDHVKEAAEIINCFEVDKERKVGFNEEDYRKSLEKLKVVVSDSTACVKRYQNKGFVSRLVLVIKFNADFDSLHKRLDKALKWFDLGLQVHQVGLLHENTSKVEELKADMNERLEVIVALVKDKIDPDPTHELSTRVEVTGDSYNEGFLLAGRLDESCDIILVPSENQKKEASILYKLSNHDNILRFYGTFLRGHGDNYLVMEKPGQELQTISDWINTEGHGDEWRLKNMVVLEIALRSSFCP